MIALNRSEFRIALDPSPENRTAVHGLIEQQMKEMDDLGEQMHEEIQRRAAQTP